MLECAAMRIAPISRSPLLQWLSFALCACVLVNALACGVLHLQALGVGSDKGQKASVGLFCVAGASQWLSLDPDDGSTGDPAPVNPQLPVSCPMCSALVLFVALGVIWSWRLQRRRQARFRPPATREPVPPRYVWPPANPRASPA
ncbi:hypothetical protein IPC703_17200 [Pseudomonas aeruginosa]|nr:hypothetical protein IPC727_16450 [Pseudomonas aeruginosa]RPX76577.1 hypothetical protein IPC703_17200 [Pseudomonas aeruginosa]